MNEHRSNPDLGLYTYTEQFKEVCGIYILGQAITKLALCIITNQQTKTIVQTHWIFEKLLRYSFRHWNVMHAGGTYLWDRLVFVITSSLKIQNQQILKQLFFVRHLSIVKTKHLSGVYLTTLFCNLKLYFHFILPRNSLKWKFSKPQNYIKDTIAQSKWRIRF